MERWMEDLLVQVCGSERALDPTVDLLEEDLLDSLGRMLLLDELLDRGIELQPTQLPLSTFRHVDALWQAVQKARGSSPE